MLYLQLFILGLPIAGLFGLLATGVVMVYRASGILNLAVGGMSMFSAYILYWATNDPGGPGWPVGVGLILALLFAAALGWVIERFLLRPLRDRPPLTSVIMTVAVLALLTALAGTIWGYDRQDAPAILPRGHNLHFAGTVVGLDRIMILVITAAAMFAVIYLFRRTTLGIAMRAVSDNRSSALLMGVPADRVSTMTWIVGSVLAGIAGILLSPIIGLQPINLTLLAIPAYAAALFGGLNSLWLTLGGAGVVGIMYSLVPSLPGIRGTNFPGPREVAIFGAVILFLFFRWQQLFGSVLQEDEA
jgi:branched-subunit amino acid ABC-type transport system permease component